METKRVWMQGRAPQKRLSTLQVLLLQRLLTFTAAVCMLHVHGFVCMLHVHAVEESS